MIWAWIAGAAGLVVVLPGMVRARRVADEIRMYVTTAISPGPYC